MTERNELLRLEYEYASRLLGTLTEIRFKLLALVPTLTGAVVALGHPIGASGGRILGTMVHELRREGGGLGLAAICSGGGQGDAVLVEA